MSPQSPFTDVPDAIEEILAGRMIMVVDDEDRENEGDLTLAAEKVTPEAINFMARHGRGLVCLAMTEERLEHLNIGPMTRRTRRNTARHSARPSTRGRASRLAFRRTTARARFGWRLIRRPGRRTWRVPDTCSLFAHVKAECWCAPDRPKPRSIWRGSQAWFRRESSGNHER